MANLSNVLNLGFNKTVQFQEFTSSGTWVRPAGVDQVFVRVVGGGAGGNGTSSSTRGGAGGGGGGIEERWVPVTGNVSVTVGNGGPGSVGNAVASNGGDSSFGSVVAKGGRAGALFGAVGGRPGNGKAEPGGKVNENTYDHVGANGGSSYGPGGMLTSVNNGLAGISAASNTGGGGSGGSSNGDTTTITGGNGGSGIVQVWWWE